jgi:hypothetical protein
MYTYIILAIVLLLVIFLMYFMLFRGSSSAPSVKVEIPPMNFF